MTGRRPKRSTRCPVSGDGRNIAAMWIEITRPVGAEPWPWSRMWIGVIVITATITIWVSDHRRGGQPDGRRDRRPRGCGGARGARAARGRRPARARSAAGRAAAGRGRRPPPARRRAVASMNGPASSRDADRLGDRPRSASTRFGPMTAPSVVATSTVLTARPRRSGVGEVGARVARLQVRGGARRRRAAGERTAAATLSIAAASDDARRRRARRPRSPRPGRAAGPTRCEIRPTQQRRRRPTRA